MKKSEIIILAIVLTSFIIGIYFYHQMPEKMVCHWNMQGQADGYMTKFWGLFLIPLIILGNVLIFIAIPRMDPLKANIEKFRKYYDGFVVLFFVFMVSIELYEILWNIGVKISINIFLPISMGILLIYLGVLCKNVKRNWSIGIRTPWTLSSENVWDKTHKIGGKLFKVAGVVAFLGIFFQRYILFFILVPVILVAAYTIIYSYFEYQKEMK